MEGTLGLAIVAAAVLAYALVSARLEMSAVTGPILFVAFGVAIGERGFGLIGEGLDEGAVGILAEATLVILLFTDATRIDLRVLRPDAAVPARLLGVGMPLTIGAGILAGLAILPGFSVWEAALLAAVLAPTDAALGQVVVTARGVPQRVRQTINVESGLNDGIALPFVTVFLAIAMSEGGEVGTWARFAAEQIGLGVGIGVLAGVIGGRALDGATRAGWVDGTFRQLGTLAVPVGAFGFSVWAGGNGFLAAFVAGLAFGAVARDHCPHVADFAEDQGQLLSLLTFMVFGAAIVGPALGSLTWRTGAYAAVSLTVVRMVPVALSLLGSGLRAPTVWFVGWFGPRGLASILFAVFIIEEGGLAGAEALVDVVTWTVVLSVLAHGVTAGGFTAAYVRWVDRARAAARVTEEDRSMPEHRPRTRGRRG